MHGLEHLASAPAQTRHAGRIRFEPLIDLASGDEVGVLADPEHGYGERVRFPLGDTLTGLADAAAWLAEMLETVAAATELLDMRARPVVIAAPERALDDPGAPDLCDSVLLRTRLCPHELCLEFEDAAIAARGSEAIEGVAAFRRCGFRVGIDARRHWEAETSAAFRLLIDTVRLDGRALQASSDLKARTCRAAGEGICVIAEGLREQDGSHVQRYGVVHALRPLSDA